MALAARTAADAARRAAGPARRARGDPGARRLLRRRSVPSTSRGWTACATADTATAPGALALTALTSPERRRRRRPVGRRPRAWRARRSTATTLLREDPGVFSAGAAQALALGEPAEGAAAWERIGDVGAGAPLGADARRRRPLGRADADLDRATSPEAEACEERAIEGEILWGTTMAAEMGYSSSFLALARLERGDLAGAREALERNEASTGTSDGSRFWRISQRRAAARRGALGGGGRGHRGRRAHLAAADAPGVVAVALAARPRARRARRPRAGARARRRRSSSSRA